MFFLTLELAIVLINCHNFIVLSILVLLHYKPKEIVLESENLNEMRKRLQIIGKRPQIIYFISISIIIYLILFYILFVMKQDLNITSLLPYGVVIGFIGVIIPYLFDQDDFWIIYSNSIITSYQILNNVHNDSVNNG